VIRHDDAKRIQHAGEHFTAMDDEGPRVRIEAPGGRVIVYTDLSADDAQRRLETIAGPFTSMHEAEHRIRLAFNSAQQTSAAN
jgi:hypothetical protein